MAHNWAPKIRRGFPPKNKFACSEIIKVKNREIGQGTADDFDVRLRSMSMDDQCMSYNSNGAATEPTRRKKICRVESDDTSFNVTINKIYANAKRIADAPTGTYGTIEKYGYLELPTPEPPVTTPVYLSSSDDNMDNNMDGRCLSVVSEENSSPDVRKFQPRNPSLNEANIYASIKGVPEGMREKIGGAQYDIPKALSSSMPVPTLSGDINPYDSVKGMDSVQNSPTLSSARSEHTYAKILDSPQSLHRIEIIPVDIQNRPLPAPTSKGATGTLEACGSSSIGQKTSLPKYEVIGDAPSSDEKGAKGGKRIKNRKNETRGVYMKFGELLTTKL